MITKLNLTPNIDLKELPATSKPFPLWKNWCQIKTIYSQIQKYIRDKVAFISLVIRDDFLVTNRRLEGKSDPNDFDIYEGIDNYIIKNK